MSMTMIAHAVIGVLVHHNEISKKVKVRGCQHSLPENAQFCPTCGRMAFELKETCLFNGDNDYTYNGIKAEYADAESANKDMVIVGQCVTAGDYEGNPEIAFQPLQDIRAIRHRLDHALTPLNLWFPERFGLYAIRYIS